MKHGVIVPLIGGEAIGVEQATGRPPEYLLSYTPFAKNDSHLVNYYKYRGLDIPYHNLDEGAPSFDTSVDSISSVCPCAGLSSLSVSSSADNPANDWMYKTAEYVLENVKPRVYWGENAPALMTDKGKKVREKLIEIGAKNGYTASFYRTKAMLHGLPQVRNRSFFFLWKGDKAPVFEFFDRPFERIENFLVNVQGNTQREPINPKIPSQDPYYEYILQVMAGGKTHREYMQEYVKLDEDLPLRGNDVACIIENDPDHGFGKLREWLVSKGYEKHIKWVDHMVYKTSIGKGTMRRNTILPKNYIGAFVSHYPYNIAHPVDDRYLDYREAMSIMGLPSDFELLDPKRSVNHICQNVPVPVARDMATEVEIALQEPEKREWFTGTIMQNNTNRKVEVTSNNNLGSFF